MKWYERERPITVWAGPISLNFYERQGALQFVSWREVSQRRELGKTFTVWIKDLARSPEAVALLERALEQARWGMEESQKTEMA